MQQKFNFKQKFAIVGFGVEGISLYNWLKKHQALEIDIFDENISEKQDFEVKIQPLKNISQKDHDLIFRSPGVHPHKILEQYILDKKVAPKISSATQLFLEICPSSEIVGVTGTKGKGTTATLIYKILSKKYSSVFLGGNIGVPVFDFFDKLNSDSVVVYEMSSFQLYDISKSPKFAVFLLTESEHLDWHKDVEDYHQAKFNISKFQSEKDFLVYFNSLTNQKILKDSVSQKFPTNPSKIDFDTKKVALPGKFNLENVACSYEIAKIFDVDKKDTLEVYESFLGLPMHLEKVFENTQGKVFINDSFSTTPETSIAAISTIFEPTNLILGGSEKFSDFFELAKEVSKSQLLNKVYLIGVTGKRIAEELEKNDFHKYVFAQSLEEIIEDFLKEDILQSKNLLLSPACASFGMFNNYKHRGETFNKIARQIS